MNFDDRLQRAIDRGTRIAQQRRGEEAAQALSEEQLKRIHSQYRLPLSEYIEIGLKKLMQHIPGFHYENVVSDRGWGGAVNRDDADLGPNRSRSNLFSRLEIVVRPFSTARVLEISARGTIRNKELFQREFHQPLAGVDSDQFNERVDRWILEYAELYSARQ